MGKFLNELWIVVLVSGKLLLLGWGVFEPPVSVAFNPIIVSI